MSSNNSPSFTALARRVNTLLYEQWDPLALAGVAPRDEYESYVPQLIRLALLGEDAREAVAMQLAQVETRQMSLTLTAPAHRLAVADQIIDVVLASGWTGAT
jgi:hypothetical protein